MSHSRRNKPRPGAVRIIGGQWRRRLLTIDEAAPVRPTPDRVRETLFNWLGPVIEDARCLDLFAGTGVLGLEALSRGAGALTLVERNLSVAASLSRHAEDLGAPARIVVADAVEFLRRYDRLPFDIVFVDPPYEYEVGTLLGSLSHALDAGSHVYLERSAAAVWPEVERLRWTRRAKAASVGYGLAVVDA